MTPRTATTAGARASRRWTAAMVLAFVAITTIVTIRTARNAIVPDHPEYPNVGLQDFRDVLYYPAVALLDGRSPYDAATFTTQYPVTRSYAPYAPIMPLLHLPFGAAPLGVAQWVHFGLNVATLVALAWVCLRVCAVPATTARVLGIAALLVLSRPGHMTLHIGQSAAYFALAVCIALGWARSAPWVSAIGIAVACAKPQFGGPLALLMLARGDHRAVLRGLVVAGVLALAGGAVMAHAAGGVDVLVRQVGDAYVRLGRDPSANPLSSLIRIDTVAFMSRVAGGPLGIAAEGAIGLAILAVAAVASRAVGGESDGHRLTSASLICLALLACTYHQAYDALLFALPLTALATDRLRIGSGRLPAAWRWLLAALLLVPAVNYGATDTVMDLVRNEEAIRRVVGAVNGAAVTMAFTMLASLVLARARVSEVAPGTAPLSPERT